MTCVHKDGRHQHDVKQLLSVSKFPSADDSGEAAIS